MLKRSNLKRGKPRKRATKPMRQVGQSTRAADHRKWHHELKQWFASQGIDHCESCGNDFGLTIMHATKRRFIQTKEDYFRAAMVCWLEHQSYDEATGEEPHEKMAAFVDELIAKRKEG